MTFRTYLKVAEVRGHVVRAWKRRENEVRGFNAVPCVVWRFLLDDGRLVEQEWAVGVDKPSAHYVIGKPRPGQYGAEAKVAAMTEEIWAEREPEAYLIVGGVRV